MESVIELETENLTTTVDLPENVNFSSSFRILIYIFYPLVFLGALGGNSLVLYVIGTVPKMRTATNILLANLAIGDLLITLLCLPFTFVSIIVDYWPFGEFLCYVVPPANAVGVLVSAFTLIVLAMERYISILHPLSPRMRKGHAGYLIGAVWIAAIIVSSPIGVVSGIRDKEENNGTYEIPPVPVCDEIGWANDQQRVNYSLALLILQYFFPLVVLTFTYSRIACVVWGIHHDSRTVGTTQLIRNVPQSRHSKGTRKAVILTLAVVLGYTLAWLPCNLTMLLLHINSSLESYQGFIYLYISSHWLAMSHTMYNPIIYAWLNSSFKRCFRDILHNCPVTRLCFSQASQETYRMSSRAMLTSFLHPSFSVDNYKAGGRHSTALIENEDHLERRNHHFYISSCNGDGTKV